MNKKVKIVFVSMLAVLLLVCVQVRTEQTFGKGWKFTHEDSKDFSNSTYDDAKQQSVTVPHGWAIYGPFSTNNDKQNVVIPQDERKRMMEHAGRTGGLPFVGVGWCCLDFEAPLFSKGKKATLVLDGAMNHARVYINGQEAGYWSYGCNSFYVDATPYLKPGEKNTLAVRFESENESSRWYPGTGLCCNVHPVVNEDVYIPTWGTQLIVPAVKDEFARVSLKTKLNILAGKTFEGYRVITKLKGKNGRVVVTNEEQGSRFDGSVFGQDFVATVPALRAPDTPNLYNAVSKVYEDDALKDEYTALFGIRSIETIPGEDFYLNGKKTMFEGVYSHHSPSPLGGITNEADIRRQTRILKDMECNAIHTPHNMPAPELVRIRDKMGMMIMTEPFDKWEAAKVQNGHYKVLGERAEKDLVNPIHQYRNNPSVVMRCIGNEIPDQRNDDHGSRPSRFPQDIYYREGPARPVTQGADASDAVVNNNMAAMMDVVGFNYRPHKYQESYKELPRQIILGSGTVSTTSSHGVYRSPMVRRAMQKYDDHQPSSYDVEHCGWSDLSGGDFIQREDLPYCAGEFVWTRFDYLDGPTPYYTDWLSHSSLFGIINLAGLPKGRCYLYHNHWSKDAETLHILSHWNWEGRKGEMTPVPAHINYPSAELFINDKSQGKHTKDLSVTVHNSGDSASVANFKRQQRYHLMWMDTKYESDTVKVAVYNKDGKTITEKEIHTAGKPDHIELVADRSVIDANGENLSFVTVKVVDKDGSLCPLTDNEVSFKVKGAGAYRAGVNGNPAPLESFRTPKMRVFSGVMTVVVQSMEKAGKTILEATGKGLKKDTLMIGSR